MDDELMRVFPAICAALILWGAAALAQMQSNILWDVPASQHGPQGPGDITPFTVWYGLRAYSAAVAATGTQQAVDLLRNDGATCTALIGKDGNLDISVGTPCNGNTQTVTAWNAAAASKTCTGSISGTTLTRSGACSFLTGDGISGTGVTAGTFLTDTNCVGSTCAIWPSQSVSSTTLTGSPFGIRVTNYYDQVSGAVCSGSCDAGTLVGTNDSILFLANATNSPCSNTALSCIFGTHTPGLKTAGTYTPGGGGMSFSTVGRSLGSAFAPITANSGQLHIEWASTPTANLGGATGSFNVSISAGIHVANGSAVAGANAATLNIDGTETAGTTGGAGTTAANPSFAGRGTSSFGETAEGGFADNAAWSTTIRNTLCHNQRIYWGIGGTC
jgi:hypothetical protein